jgi:two-component system sensor histidine kinase HydH
MWKHGLLATVIVALIWLTSSLVTSSYLVWLEGSYEKSLQHNLASIDAADAIREDVWRLNASSHSNSKDGSSSVPAAEIESRIRANLRRLDSTASTQVERTLLAEIRDLVGANDPLPEGSVKRPDGLSSRASPIGTRSWAEQISAKADQISKIDHHQLEQAAQRRLEIGSRIFWGRLVAILVGPVIGILLGWWISRRLVRTVTQIRVTLTGTAIGSDGELGTVQFSGKDDLDFIRQQIETVVERLRRTGSELERARVDALRSERLAAIGGLAAGVAHELRNPLTSVKLLLQHAASRPGDAVFPLSKLRLILDEVGRMEGTIQGLLDFSRPPVLQCARHDLCETVRRATNLVEGRAASQGVRLAVDFEDCPIIIDGDPQQLHQVFVNLLINGIEAMPSGGLLRVHVALSKPRSEVQIRIEDNGSGFPAEILAKLFEPFATSKERGTGLGLAVSRRIVQEHGGVIEAANRPEGGAVLKIVLPCRAEPRDPGATPVSLSVCADA